MKLSSQELLYTFQFDIKDNTFVMIDANDGVSGHTEQVEDFSWYFRTNFSIA